MRDYKLYLEDILKAVKNIETYTKGINFKELEKNNLIVDGVVRNLEIIGEAVKGIPARIKDKYVDVEWKKISGLRDILIHQYFGIDLEILWDIVTRKLPVLKKNISRILKEIK